MRASFFTLITLFIAAVCSMPSIALSVSESAQDCACQQVEWQVAFDSARHVVFGEVKTIQRHNDDLATGDFSVLETFKGDSTFIKKVVGSSIKNKSCRKVLKQGFYILYSFGSNNVVLKQCSASKKLNSSKDLVSTISEIKKYSQSQMPNNKVIEQKTNSEKQAGTNKNRLQAIFDWFKLDSAIGDENQR